MFKKLLSVALVALIATFGLALGGCDENLDSYDVIVKVNGAKYGDVYGGNDTYTVGTNITIKAKPKATTSQTSQNVFVCWVHDNKVVSTEAEYTFKLSFETAGTYVALFECADLEYVAINNLVINSGTFLNVGTAGASISKLSLKMGYSENRLIEVYSSDDVAFVNESLTLDSSSFLHDENFPYVFDKTRNLFVKVDITYLYSSSEIEYVSSTIITIPATEVGGGVPSASGELNAPVMTGGSLVLPYSTAPTLEVNFISLSDFDLGSDVVEEE